MGYPSHNLCPKGFLISTILLVDKKILTFVTEKKFDDLTRQWAHWYSICCLRCHPCSIIIKLAGALLPVY